MREKKAKFEQLNKYSDVQLGDKVRYMTQQSEKSESALFLLLLL